MHPAQGKLSTLSKSFIRFGDFPAAVVGLMADQEMYTRFEAVSGICVRRPREKRPGSSKNRTTGVIIIDASHQSLATAYAANTHPYI
jgi:hypothetical protein